MFLSTSRGITHFPPTLSTEVTFQVCPRSTRNNLSVYLCMNPRCQETKGYLGNTNSLGGQSQARLVRMGRVAEPETLSRIESPDAQKSWVTLWQGFGGLSPLSKPPRGLVLNSRLRGASQIQSIKSRNYLVIGQLRLKFNTCGEFKLPIPQV